MQRKLFDNLVSAVGAVLTVTLLVAGGLLMWGYNFTSTNVHNQLAEQQIYFPPRSAFADAKPGTEITPGMIPYLEKYAGQELVTGAQAEAYADHFIAVHLSEMPLHGVYSKLSAASMEYPNNQTYATYTQLSFRGTTLRGLLLEAYAFSQFGVIALWAGVVSFILAGIMAILTAFGFWHARKVSPEVALGAAKS